MEKQTLSSGDFKNRFLGLFKQRALNIYPTDYCNYRCVFCKMHAICRSRAGRHEMDAAALKKLIAFSKRSGIKMFRILGGEPTQHPRLVQMIETIYNAGLAVDILFTNGIFRNDKLIGLIKEKDITVNFHYFPPEEYTSEEHKLVQRNMRLLFDNGQVRRRGKKPLNPCLRCTSIIFYKKNQDYQYIIDASLRYKIAYISWSFAHPSLSAGNRHVRWKDLAGIVPTALNFVREAATKGIRTSLECPVTPCVFTQKQLRFARRHISDFSFTCEPILDVFPDLSVHYCMGLPIVSRISDTNTLKDILIDQLCRSEVLRSRLRAPGCKKCQWWESKKCQGYCLHYKCKPADFLPGGPLNGLEWAKKYALLKVKGKLV